MSNINNGYLLILVDATINIIYRLLNMFYTTDIFFIGHLIGNNIVTDFHVIEIASGIIVAVIGLGIILYTYFVDSFDVGHSRMKLGLTCLISPYFISLIIAHLIP